VTGIVVAGLLSVFVFVAIHSEHSAAAESVKFCGDEAEMPPSKKKGSGGEAAPVPWTRKLLLPL